MTKTLKREALLPFLTASFIGIAMLPGYSRADDGYRFPGNYVDEGGIVWGDLPQAGNGEISLASDAATYVDEGGIVWSELAKASGGERRADAVVCADATNVAFFERQLALSEGNGSPEVAMPAACDRSILASVDTDED